MKTFKEHKKEKDEEKVGIAPDAIHFRDIARGTAPTFIHFRDVAKKITSKIKGLKEAVNDLGSLNGWFKKRDNEHLSNKTSDVSHHKEVTKQISSTNNFSPEHVKHVERYADMSSDINKSLIKNSGAPAKKHEKSVAGLDDAIDKNRIQKPLTVYSGTSFNPEKHIDKKGHMRSPAYISATHDKRVAAGYAQQSEKNPMSRKPRHIIQFNLKAGDPATHISQHSAYTDEHETVIRRGVTLQHHGTESHWDNNNENWYHVHHMSIVPEK